MRIWTEERLKELRKHAGQGLRAFEIAEIMGIRTKTVQNAMRDYKIRNGQRGKRVKENFPIGTERLHDDGFSNLHFKVKTKTGWVRKSKVLWTQHHGVIPKGMKVIYKDGNPMNCTIDNLDLVTQAQSASITIKRFFKKDLQRYQLGMTPKHIANKWKSGILKR